MNTTYFLNCVAGNVFGSKTSPSLPKTYYVGLSASAPAMDGSGVTEPTTGNYSRAALSALEAPVDGVVTNAESIKFPMSTGSWGTVTHYVIYDNISAGNLLKYGELPEALVIDEATVAIIKPGYLKLSALNP